MKSNERFPIRREHDAQGYRPAQDEPPMPSNWAIFGGLIAWALVLVVFVLVALPLLDWLAEHAHD